MNKIKIKGLGNLQLDQSINEDTDYAITLRIAREGKYLPDKHGEETGSETYSCKVINVELLQEIGKSKEIDVRQIKSKSKQLRDIIWRLGNKKGVNDDEEYYTKIMDSIIQKVAKRIDEI